MEQGRTRAPPTDQAQRKNKRGGEKKSVTELIGGVGAVGALPEREAGEEHRMFARR